MHTSDTLFCDTRRGMLKWLRSALSVVALGVTIVGLSAGAGAIVESPDGAIRQTALHLPGVEPGTRVIAAAMADIDADGDLDLVASDGSLDLLVWSNDGTGHFTRKYPAHDQRSGSLMRDGALDSGSGAVPASVVPAAGGSFIAPDQFARGVFAQSRRPLVSVAHLLRSGARLSRSPRAPPTLSITT